MVFVQYPLYNLTLHGGLLETQWLPECKVLTCLTLEFWTITGDSDYKTLNLSISMTTKVHFGNSSPQVTKLDTG